MSDIDYSFVGNGKCALCGGDSESLRVCPSCGEDCCDFCLRPYEDCVECRNRGAA